MPSLTIDGRTVVARDGATVIQAAEELGIFVPRYCYHPALSVAGNCRICLVEVEKLPKLQIACNTPVAEGMVVHTQSAKAAAGRRAVLEFLLANHPLDCPVCDQSGECDLQNFYMTIGLYDPRFRELKVKKKKALKLGPHVMLDQERCILCSRCVRFTDEITKTGEFGIFNRGDRAELGLYPGEVLDNPYSANVVDICPVGALTEADSRFKARVWYLSSAATICNGCSQGCNIDLHYVLDRPHLNDGARLVRVKPRVNPHVNGWWLCDEGRFGLGWLDRGRLREVRGPAAQAPADWERALAALAAGLAGARAGPRPRIGVLASAQLTNEELFLVRELFRRELGALVSAAVPERPGSCDEFLRKADKHPNTMGATLLGLAGPNALAGERIVEGALAGELDVLWIFGHDLAQLFDEERARRLAERVPLLVYSGTNESATAALAHWVLPSAAYVEKDGTFVNCHGRVQRIGRAFPPLAGAREDWRVLLDLAARLGLPSEWRGPEEIFRALAGAPGPFQGLDYRSIGAQGATLASAADATEAAAPCSRS
jgi:NADH-quinone oxidoreductase subunit G